MVKVALKDIDFEAVRRIALVAAVTAPLAILGACSQQSDQGSVSGTANQETTPPAAAPSGDQAAPAAPAGSETPAAPDEGAGSSDQSGAAPAAPATPPADTNTDTNSGQ